MESPQNVSELRSFIGLVSYYRRFIKDFSKIAKCLFDLLQLKAHWEWTSGCEQTFRLLKEKLSSSPVLAYPEIDGEEFILDTDASHFGIGANKDFCKQCNLPWDYVYNNSSDKSDSLNIIDQQCETQHSQIISTIDENENEDLDSEDLPKRRGPKRNAPSKAKGLKKPVIDLSPESIRELQSDNEILDKSMGFTGMKNGMLCEYWEDGPTYSRWRVCAPCEIQKYVLWQIHDSPTSGHQGINRTWQRAKMCPFYWKGMRQSVIDYVKSCDICEEKKDPKYTKRHELKSYVTGGRFERIGTDIAGPFPISNNGNMYIVVIEDYFTKFIEIFPIPNMEAKTVAEVMLKGWIKRYGCPLELHSDQGIPQSKMNIRQRGDPSGDPSMDPTRIEYLLEGTPTMFYFRIFSLSLSIITTWTSSTRTDSESLLTCSKFHFEENVLEKLVRLEHKMELIEDKMKIMESSMSKKAERMDEIETETKTLTETMLDKQLQIETRINDSYQEIVDNFKTLVNNV
ncbi:unnamed protein product [Mytilus edulis]|uniref:Integrase catalytic domain-containing protein n=1 Tax=Mytilus edulis TaxID=6550 RepID=A0A8S3QDF4_MYTED|nr:unnamed protein product [Mytilus edulis]